MNNDEQIMLALSKLSQGITSIQGDLVSVKEDLASVRAAVVKIEYEHGAKLQALIDGQVALEEKLGGHEQRIVKLEYTSDQHDAKISTLFKKAL